MNKYHLFWKGVFSQWYASQFTDKNSITFTCAEQFMMFYKAVLFEDGEIAGDILATKNPAVQRKLGRQVRRFSESMWFKVARNIVYAGNEYKFTQNPDLLKRLVSTYPLILVEASPRDKIWGVDLAVDNPDIKFSDKWRGTNWLGEVLTSLRSQIMRGNSSLSSASNTMETISSNHWEIIRIAKHNAFAKDAGLFKGAN